MRVEPAFDRVRFVAGLSSVREGQSSRLPANCLSAPRPSPKRHQRACIKESGLGWGLREAVNLHAEMGGGCGQASDGTPCRTSGVSTLPMRRGAPPSRESHPLGPNHRRDRRSGRASRPGAADAGQGGAQPEVPHRGGDTHVLKWPDIPCSLTPRFSGGWHSGPSATTDC
jgi:hypothetical protein